MHDSLIALFTGAAECHQAEWLHKLCKRLSGAFEAAREAPLHAEFLGHRQLFDGVLRSARALSCWEKRNVWIRGRGLGVGDPPSHDLRRRALRRLFPPLLTVQEVCQRSRILVRRYVGTFIEYAYDCLTI